MIAFPHMLVPAANAAGMPVPLDPDKFDSETFPHFHVFCLTQLCRPIQWGEQWDNAEVISSLSPEECRTITLEGLIAKGFRYTMYV